ncbi:polyphenol oxidase family protein [Nocardioides sp. LHG3406-4]|uniref:polyphenol oxidase family protein n=1 Tax=Nocardioides sp. LHG3406-4 TaxID=2804575 RepID=UPI003CE74A5C
MFAFRDRRGPVEVAFTDRHAGGAFPPGTPLNLSLRRDGVPVSGPDAPGVEALEGVFASCRAPVGLTQVHGGDVVVVDEEYDGRELVADALVTSVPGLPLMVRAADCVPVLLADAEGRVVGAAHAGRPGLVAEVVPHTVAALRGLGAADLRAWVGPHVCGACYEVPADMQAEVVAAVPESASTTSWGTPALDIGAGVRAQLDALGVPHRSVHRCTREDDDLWSHRRSGPAAGRLAGLVVISP